MSFIILFKKNFVPFGYAATATLDNLYIFLKTCLIFITGYLSSYSFWISRAKTAFSSLFPAAIQEKQQEFREWTSKQRPYSWFLTLVFHLVTFVFACLSSKGLAYLQEHLPRMQIIMH